MEKVKGAIDTASVFGVQIELHSNREAVIDGCNGVMDYYENRIKFNIGKGAVTFNGDNLEMVSYYGDSAVIRGYITSVEFGS